MGKGNFKEEFTCDAVRRSPSGACPAARGGLTKQRRMRKHPAENQLDWTCLLLATAPQAADIIGPPLNNSDTKDA
jgi:hypothetical protein